MSTRRCLGALWASAMMLASKMEGVAGKSQNLKNLNHKKAPQTTRTHQVPRASPSRIASIGAFRLQHVASSLLSAVGDSKKRKSSEGRTTLMQTRPLSLFNRPVVRSHPFAGLSLMEMILSPARSSPAAIAPAAIDVTTGPLPEGPSCEELCDE